MEFCNFSTNYGLGFNFVTSIKSCPDSWKLHVEFFEHATSVFFVINKNNGDDKSIARKPEQEKKNQRGLWNLFKIL